MKKMDIVSFFVFLNTVFDNRVMNQFEAAKEGDLQQLRVALTVDNWNDCDEYGKTALHWAAEHEQLDCVKYCIEMGANVNARANGSTPLHYASSWGYANVAGILLDAGALVDVANNVGNTPLHLAIEHVCVDVAQILIDRGAKVSNVKLDRVLPAIPDWVTAFIESRSKCRTAANIIIGIHKYHRTNVTGNNDINVIRLISKHIWSTRMDDVWYSSK
jgi:ankyrin repeat protein